MLLQKHLPQKQFRFSIDRGGTFTDIYAETPDGNCFKVIKLLSDDPKNYSDAPREGIRRILEACSNTPFQTENIDTHHIEWIRMGTTVATNALLERKGAKTALIITKGYRDILQIGNQDRPKLFDLKIVKPEPLYEEVIEVNERIRLLQPNDVFPEDQIVQGITGDRFVVLKPVNINFLKQKFQWLQEKGIHSLAIVFMHAYSWPVHEETVAQLAKDMGFSHVSMSSHVMPAVKLVPRGDTTLVDAYLTPMIKEYLSSFRQGFSGKLNNNKLLFMQSNGGLVQADDFIGSRAILSGPAGGVVGLASTPINPKEHQAVIGFDMGGTSTDVSRFDGTYEVIHETQTAGVRIQAPQLNIKTVAAGGGSRLFFENGLLIVGPESSGANPGPVCYRKNGYLSVTDANLILGRLQPAYFPSIFGPEHDQPLDLHASRKAMEKLLAEINDHNIRHNLKPMRLEEAALGYIKVANEVMVRPIRELSVMRGFDIQAHILSTFGGAGPQHACAIARILGISKIFIHRFSGILSAYGLGLADIIIEKQMPASETYSPDNRENILSRKSKLSRLSEDDLLEKGFDQQQIAHQLYLNLRYDGTNTAFMIPEPQDFDFIAAFKKIHYREFGFDLTNRDIMVDDIRVVSTAKTSGVKRVPIPQSSQKAQPVNQMDCYFEEGWQTTSVYQLDQLYAGQILEGPALIIQDTSTILVEPACHARITVFGDVEIHLGEQNAVHMNGAIHPVQLTIFSHLFMSIAEQMGRTLEKTSVSTNIKERRDFSCALFDANGELVANAPHLPIHLGAMSEAVKAQIRIHQGSIEMGDVLLSNHPKAGGSHLPDITVITPVFYKDNIIFWTASRGHHADIGGISPGSMPPNSKSLEEEGICIESFKLVKKGIFQEKDILAQLLAPEKIAKAERKKMISSCRNPSDNISDLKAQIAANQKGIDLVLEMIQTYSLETVLAYMGHVRQNAQQAVRRRLIQLAEKKGLKAQDKVQAIDYMDDGSLIKLTLSIDHQTGSAIFDFSGTGKAVKGNLNAPIAVTKSAILYSLRCLIEKDLPLNDGCLIPIQIHIPPGSILDPPENAAVVGGNVLTSQRIVDVILKAFGIAAASQGCMNNFTFGNDHFGYYETIGGGAGAGPGWHGQSGVHTHMTNTRITDPEILERQYPVMLRSFSIRSGSGGKGQFMGGDGLIREIEFLCPLSIAILSDRRVYPPYGLNGGENGMLGKNEFIDINGKTIHLGGKNERRANAGDRIRILTPGGGGFGVFRRE